jgi:hypothetical protein
LVSADCPLQVIGAGPAGMSLSLVLALCNRVATANGRDISEARLLESLHIIEANDAAGEPSFNGGIHGFQSYPLSIAPRIVNCLTAQASVEKFR